MNKIESYSTYQMNFYENTVQNKKAENEVKSNQTEQTKTTQPELSDAAQKLLERLKATYKDMDFMVGEYSSDEEAATYLSRGTKEYSVLMDPETLEKMAADKKTEEKYLNVLDNAKADFANIEAKLGDEGKEVTHLGISMNKDGKVSYFADLEKMSDKQMERIEKNKETKKEQAAAAEKKKKARVKADSIEELKEKIKQIDWDKIKAEQPMESGSKFDYSI